MFVLLQLCCILSAAVALDPRINFPREYDCPLKELAFERALLWLSNASAHRRSASWPAVLYDALELGVRCGAPPLAPAPPAPAPVQTDVPPGAIFVAANGSDTRGSGAASAPFASLHRAVVQARISSNKRSTVVLRGGHYFLNQTLALKAADSGLTLMAFPSEEPVLHGGVALTDLVWAPAGGRFHPAVRVASVAHLPLQSWDGMTADGKLLWRARYPDVPEFGRQLQPNGWVPVHSFTSRLVPDPQPVTSSLPCRNRSAMPCYSETLGGNGNRFANKRSFCHDGPGGCDMGASSITPDSIGMAAAAKEWAHPETGVAVYLNGPDGFDAWWNWGSFIQYITNTTVPGPGQQKVPPYINISGFALRPERVGVGTPISDFNCTVGQCAADCVRAAAQHCTAIGDSCGGVGYCAPCFHAQLFTGGHGVSNGTVSQCGNTEWNYWCKPGRCGLACPDGPFRKPSQPWHRTIELGDGDWQAVTTPNRQAVSMMYVENSEYIHAIHCYVIVCTYLIYLSTVTHSCLCLLRPLPDEPDT